MDTEIKLLYKGKKYDGDLVSITEKLDDAEIIWRFDIRTKVKALILNKNCRLCGRNQEKILNETSLRYCGLIFKESFICRACVYEIRSIK